MKFKMEASKDASNDGENSNHARSGIYDVSRMTNIKSPVDRFGNTVSQKTKSRADEAEKRAKSTSEIIRGLLVTLAVPLIAGAVYLSFSSDQTTTPDPLSVANTPPPPSIKREPAQRAALPPDVDVSTPSTEEIDNSASGKPMALKLILDSNGQLLSPFSIELDENADEIARHEIADHPGLLRTLPLGQFENVSGTANLSTILPKDFVSTGPSRPFAFTEAERRRITQLRASAPEISMAIQNFETMSRSRLSITPNAVSSFSDRKISMNNKSDARIELRWLRAASIARDISGDRSVEKRLLTTLMMWVRTYQPTGEPLREGALFDALFAYDQIRHLWSTTDQQAIDGFFQRVVDVQFQHLKTKPRQEYDLEHATHLRFAIAVGAVTGNPALQAYGQQQYKFHVENSQLMRMDTFGEDEVTHLTHLLRTAYVLERSGAEVFQSTTLKLALSRAIDVLRTASQTTGQNYVEAMAVAAYFRQDLYAMLPSLTQAAGIRGSRFGTSEGALMAAVRKPTSSLISVATITPPNKVTGTRLPTAIPTKLPPKRSHK